MSGTGRKTRMPDPKEALPGRNVRMPVPSQHYVHGGIPLNLPIRKAWRPRYSDWGASGALSANSGGSMVSIQRPSVILWLYTQPQLSGGLFRHDRTQ